MTTQSRYCLEPIVFMFEALVLPSNTGQIFLQAVTPPSLVYWPNAVSRKNTGIPQQKRNTQYGMRKTPNDIRKFYFYDLFLLSQCKHIIPTDYCQFKKKTNIFLKIRMRTFLNVTTIKSQKAKYGHF